MKFFFDLDGTLIDIADRYYRVYSDILTEKGFLTIGKEQYWAAKRRRVPEGQILAMTNSDGYYEEYIRKRLLLIEDSYLSYDCLHDGVEKILEHFSNKHELILVTLRRSAIQLKKQLVSLGIVDYFTDVLSSGEDIQPRWMIKYNLIGGYLAHERDPSYTLISDTESDIKAGNALGLRTIAVLNGIRNKALLMMSNPDLICNTVTDLLKYETIGIDGRK